MNDSHLDPGSFRDVAGNVHIVANRILRTVNECTRKDYEIIRDSGVIADAIANKFLIESNEVAR
jgi:hypothetical protein